MSIGCYLPFGAKRTLATEAYRQSVSRGREASSPWADLNHQVYRTDETFVDTMLSRLDAATALSEVPATQHRSPPMPLEHNAKTAHNRDQSIVAAYRCGGYSMKIIGEHFGLHHSMVSRIVRKEGDST